MLLFTKRSGAFIGIVIVAAGVVLAVLLLPDRAAEGPLAAGGGAAAARASMADPAESPEGEAGLIEFDGASSLSAEVADDLQRAATSVFRWLSGRSTPDDYIASMVSRGGTAGSSTDSKANGVRGRDPAAFPDDEIWRDIGTMGRLDKLMRYYDERFAPMIGGNEVEVQAWVGEQRLPPTDFFGTGGKGAASRFRPERGPATALDEAWVRVRASFRGEEPCLIDIRFVRDRDTGRWLPWAMSIAGEGTDHNWAF